MLLAAVIPAKGNSERIPLKNLQLINGKPLIAIAVEKLLQANCFDSIFVDTESQEIIDVVSVYPIKIIKRSVLLATNATDGNQLLKWEFDSGLNQFDYIFQFGCTCPLIKAETIRNLTQEFVQSKEYDSVITVLEKKEYNWVNGIPDYNLDILPNSVDRPPVLQETHAIYGITKDAFMMYNRRVGANPLLYKISEAEAYDINTEEDLKIVRCLAENVCRDYI